MKAQSATSESSYKISQEKLQKLLDYLQKKPYHEVYELINMIIEIANKEQ